MLALLLTIATAAAIVAAPPRPPRPSYVAAEAYPVFWEVRGPNSSDFSAGGSADVTKFGIKDASRSYCGGLGGSFPTLPFAENASGAENGGVPQAANLSLHLELTQKNIEAKIPDKDFDGLATFDFEAWTPVWEDNGTPAATNWHSIRYQLYSIELVKAKNPSWSAAKLAAQAKIEFEAAATELFVKTLTTASALRPKALWGFYGMPSGSFTPTPANRAQALADAAKMKPIWEASGALFPSIYLGNRTVPRRSATPPLPTSISTRVRAG